MTTAWQCKKHGGHGFTRDCTVCNPGEAYMKAYHSGWNDAIREAILECTKDEPRGIGVGARYCFEIRDAIEELLRK